MSERCERCRKGYGQAPAKEQVEWLPRAGVEIGDGARGLRVGRCRKCGSFLVDAWRAEKGGKSRAHEIVVVNDEAAETALVGRDPLSLAVIARQLRRPHLERIVDALPESVDDALARIEDGSVESTESLRALVTWRRASRGTWPRLPPGSFPVIDDARRGERAGAAALEDGSILAVDVVRGQRFACRRRGDAVAWRVPIEPEHTAVHIAAVEGSMPLRALLLAGGIGADARCVSIDVESGATVSRTVSLQAGAFHAMALPLGRTLVSSLRDAAVLDADGAIVWRAAVPQGARPTLLPAGALLACDPGRLVFLDAERCEARWSMPWDPRGRVVPFGADTVLLLTTDAVVCGAVETDGFRLRWAAQGSESLVLPDRRVALVRERGPHGFECVTLGSSGQRVRSIPRPESNRAPTMELSPGTLVFASPRDVTVVRDDGIAYALTVPMGDTVQVRAAESPPGLWVVHPRFADRLDERGRRVGRWSRRDGAASD